MRNIFLYFVVFEICFFLTCAGAAEREVSVLSTQKDQKVREAIIIEVVENGRFLTDSGTLLSSLSEMEKFLQQINPDASAPRLILNLDTQFPNRSQSAMAALLLFEKYFPSYSLVVHQEPIASQ